MSGKRKLWQFSTIFFGQTKQNLKNTPNYTFAFSFSFTLMTKMMPEKKNQNQALKTFVVKSLFRSDSTIFPPVSWGSIDKFWL